MPTQVTTRPLTAGDRELLRTAILTNVDWTGEQRFTSRDVGTPGQGIGCRGEASIPSDATEG